MAANDNLAVRLDEYGVAGEGGGGFAVGPEAGIRRALGVVAPDGGRSAADPEGDDLAIGLHGYGLSDGVLQDAAARAESGNDAQRYGGVGRCGNGDPGKNRSRPDGCRWFIFHGA